MTESTNQNDTLVVLSPNLWWPKGSIKANGSYGYLHSLDLAFKCTYNEKEFMDFYQMSVGIRSLNWSKSPINMPSFTINNEPFYCKGVNKHEDFAVKFIYFSS